MKGKDQIMRNISIRFALTLVSGLWLAPLPALAGSSFGDGSFDVGGGSVSVTPPPPPIPAATGDNFGGSFEGGGGATPPPVPGSQPADPGSGGGSFGPGSFDPPPVTPEPVVEPEPVPPQPPVQPEVPIDKQIMAFESRDYGVAPSPQLRQGDFHGPTPISLPGGQVVSTQVLVAALQARQQVVLIDVLGSDYSLPNAYVAPALASGGGFSDRTQQQATQWLGQITGNDKAAIIVVYCSDPMCWLSYNAGLRTLAAGYSNVYWYRGGLKAWKMAGLQLYPTGF